MKLTMSAWPILFVSHELNAENDNGFRLREIIHELENTQQCTVIRSFTYEDAAEIFLSRADLSTIVLDWDLPLEDADEKENPSELTAAFRKRNRTIPILLLTDRLETENLSADDLARVKPIYETMPGWQCSTAKADSLAKLPPNAQNYLRRLGELVHAEVAIVSVGPRRDQTFEV